MDCDRDTSSSHELLQGLKVDTLDFGVEDSLGDQGSEEASSLRKSQNFFRAEKSEGYRSFKSDRDSLTNSFPST